MPRRLLGGVQQDLNPLTTVDGILKETNFQIRAPKDIILVFGYFRIVKISLISSHRISYRPMIRLRKGRSFWTFFEKSGMKRHCRGNLLVRTWLLLVGMRRCVEHSCLSNKNSLINSSKLMSCDKCLKYCFCVFTYIKYIG